MFVNEIYMMTQFYLPFYIAKLVDKYHNRMAHITVYRSCVLSDLLWWLVCIAALVTVIKLFKYMVLLSSNIIYISVELN